LIKIDSIGLVNVIAQRKIVPEFVQGQFRHEQLIPEMESLLFHQQRRSEMINELKKIKDNLGKPGASSRSAKMAIELMNSKPTS